MVFLLIIFTFFTIIFTSTVTTAQTADKSLNAIKESYDDSQFEGTLRMEGPISPDADEIKIIFFKGTVKQEESTDKIVTGSWSYQTDVSTWEEGEYLVRLFAHDINGSVIGEANFKIRIVSGVTPGPKQGEIFDDNFIDKYENKEFSDELKMSKTLPDDVYSVQIKITKSGEVKVDKTETDLQNSWSYETSVKDWETGTYNVVITARNITGDSLDTAAFKFEVKKEAPFYMPTYCAIMLIIFIVLFIVFFILSILKNKKVMAELRFEPKDVEKKLPMMSYISMLVTLFLVLAGLAAIITAELELLLFLIFLAGLGLLMLITYWTFSNRIYIFFIFYIILAVVTIIIISITAIWSPIEGLGLIIGSGFISTGLIFIFIFLLIYWLTSKRGFMIPMVVVNLSLAFCIIHIVLIVLSVIELFISWWLALIAGSVLLVVMLLLSWIVLREDLFYFETREESKTHRGYRMTFNMFDIISNPIGVFKRTYDRKVMAKISYEKTHDKKVRVEVIQLRDWETLAGKSQGRRIMGAFVNKMTGKEGPMFNKERVSESVKYTTYSSDTNLDDKLKLVKAFGFQVMESGKERGLDYYDLELVKKPFLGLALGSGMTPDKPKMDFEKESGWKHGKDVKKDKLKDKEAPERDSGYDYEREREKEVEARERDSREAREQDRYRESDRERERERDRARYRDRESRKPDEDVDDWSAGRRSDRGYDSSSGRGYEREQARRPPPRREYEQERKREPKRDHAPDRWPVQREEPPPEKPKKRPPPPRIIAD